MRSGCITSQACMLSYRLYVLSSIPALIKFIAMSKRHQLSLQNYQYRQRITLRYVPIIITLLYFLSKSALRQTNCMGKHAVQGSQIIHILCLTQISHYRMLARIYGNVWSLSQPGPNHDTLILLLRDDIRRNATPTLMRCHITGIWESAAVDILHQWPSSPYNKHYKSCMTPKLPYYNDPPVYIIRMSQTNTNYT